MYGILQVCGSGSLPLEYGRDGILLRWHMGEIVLLCGSGSIPHVVCGRGGILLDVAGVVSCGCVEGVVSCCYVAGVVSFSMWKWWYPGSMW